MNNARHIKKTVPQKTMNIVAFIIIIFGALTMIFPYLWMFFTSFKSSEEAMAVVPTLFPSTWHFDTYRQIITDYPFFHSIGNTLIIEVSVITVGTFFSALAAFAFSKLRMPFKKGFLLILLSSMMIPYATVMLPQYQVYQSLGLSESLWPLILPGFFGNVSMMFFLIQYMRGIPTQLIEAAKIDGHSYISIFFQIILPLAKPALAAQIVFWFVGIWNDYFAPSIYLTSPDSYTLQVLIANLQSTFGSGTNFALVMTGSFLSSVPMLVIYISFQRFFMSTSITSGVKE